MQTARVNCCSLLLFIFCSQFLFTFSLHNFCSQFLSKFCSHHCSQLLYTTFIHKFWPQFHNFWFLILLLIDVRNFEFFLGTFVHIFLHYVSTTFVHNICLQQGCYAILHSGKYASLGLSPYFSFWSMLKYTSFVVILDITRC